MGWLMFSVARVDSWNFRQVVKFEKLKPSKIQFPKPFFKPERMFNRSIQFLFAWIIFVG